ncbi:MAG: hypothetical protein WCI12_10000 [Actinomycetes bacterium]
MRNRWLSPRALLVHLGVLAWVAGCLAAGWWQAARAFDGNALSYVYAIEWPIFAIAGIIGWWALIHTDPASAAERAERKAFEDAQRAAIQAAKRRPEDEDDALKAYNDHLEQLAAEDHKRS